MEPRSTRVPASDEITLHLLEWSQEGVPMLLIHGFGNEAHIWDDFAPHVAEYYAVNAISLRGHGDSDHDPHRRYDYTDHLRDIEAVLDQLAPERVVLIGHSLGGRVSMRYASEHADRVAGLVLVDIAPELDPRGPIRMRVDVQEHRDPVFASSGEYETYLSHAYPAATPAAIRRMATHGLRKREDGRLMLKMDDAMRSWSDAQEDPAEAVERDKQTTKELWAALGLIQCPTLVVRGAASDFLSPDVADRMVDEVLAKGSLAVVPQAGHSVMTDNPDGFRDCVTSFVLGEG